MSTSRRTFIKRGSLSAALIAGSLMGLEKSVFGQSNRESEISLPKEVYGQPLFSYDQNVFEKLLGTSFTLMTEDFAETAVLAQVRKKLPAEKKTSRQGIFGKREIESSVNFMISFRVSSPEVKQDIYQVFHKELGLFDLLLVPSKNDKGEVFLDAVINRL